MALNVGELYALFTIDTAGAISGLNSMGAKLASIGTDISHIGLLWQRSITNPIKYFFKDAIETGMSYTEELQKTVAKANIDIKTEEGLEAYRMLDEEAMRVAKDSVYTATQVAGAYDKMAMAGWQWQSMIAGLEPIMDLAAASGEDVVTVSDIVTDAMTAFGYTFEEAGHDISAFNKMVFNFTDVLAAAATASNTDVAKMGESFKYAGTMAGALEYNIEDVAIWLGLMANRGIKASQAGTTLRRVLTNMIKPTDDAEAVMQSLGLSLDRGEDGMYNLMSVMQQMRASFNNIDEDVIGSFLHLSEGVFDEWEGKYIKAISAYNDAMDAFGDEKKIPVDVLNEYNAALDDLSGLMTQLMEQDEFKHSDAYNMLYYASVLGGARGMTGILSLVTASEEEFNNLAEAVYGSEGRAHEMKETMLDTAKGDLDMFISSVDVLKTQIEKLVDDQLRELLQTAKSIIDSFIAMDDETKTTILQMAGVAAAIGPALVGIGLLMRMLPTLGSMFSFVASPIGLVAIALGALAVSALDSDNKISNAMKNIGKAFGLDDADLDLSGADLTEMLDSFLGSIGNLADNEAVQGFMSRLGEGFKGAMSSIGNISGDIVSYILSPEGARKIFDAGVSIAKLLGAGVKALWDGLWGLGKGFVEGILGDRSVVGDYKIIGSELSGDAYAMGIQNGAAFLAGWVDLFTDYQAAEEASLWADKLYSAYLRASDGADFSAIWQSWERNIGKSVDWASIGYESADEWWNYVYIAMKEGAEGGNWGHLLELVSGIGAIETVPLKTSAEETAKAMNDAFNHAFEEIGGSDISAEGMKGIQKTVNDEGDQIADAAAEVADEAVKQFLFTMSQENGALIATTYLSGMSQALLDPEGTLSSAAGMAASSVITAFQSILSAERGASIGSSFISAVVGSISSGMNTSALLPARPYAGASAYSGSSYYGTQGISASQLAGAVRSGLNGVTVQMDGVTVGNIVTPTVSKNIATEANFRG